LMLGTCLLYRNMSINSIIITILAVTAICFVYAYYSRDFFWYTAFAAVCAFLLWTTKSRLYASFTAFNVGLRAFLIIVPLACAAIVFIIKRNNGTLKLGKFSKTVFSGDAKYLPFFISAALMIASVILTMFQPALFIYSFIAFMAVYLVFAIVCTVRMI